MKHLIIGVTVAVITAISAAVAQAPEGFTKIYGEPTKANLGGRPVIADIELFASGDNGRQNSADLALVTDVTKFIAETEQDLENWVAARQDRCGERWSASKPKIDFPKGKIRFAIDLEVQVWNCGWNGKGKPRRLALEEGGVDVTLEPFISNGKLQATLGEFSIDARQGVSKYLPLEFVVKRVLSQELKKLNDNRKFYRAPSPLFEEGFVYSSINGRKVDNGNRVIITAIYTSPRADLDRLVLNLRDTGLRQ